MGMEIIPMKQNKHLGFVNALAAVEFTATRTGRVATTFTAT